MVQPNLSITNSPRSLPVIIGAAVLPMLVGMAVVYWILSQLAGFSLTTGFASQYINTLQTIVASFDFLIMAVFGVLFVGVIIRSARIQAGPLMGMVGLIILPVIVISAAYLNDLLDVFLDFQILQSAFNNFPLSITFFENIAPITAVASVLVLFVMVGGGILARR